VKCGEGHLTTECPHPKTTKKRCANCSGEHTANYKGCEKFKEKVKAVQKPKITANDWVRGFPNNPLIASRSSVTTAARLPLMDARPTIDVRNTPNACPPQDVRFTLNARSYSNVAAENVRPTAKNHDQVNNLTDLMVLVEISLASHQKKIQTSIDGLAKQLSAIEAGSETLPHQRKKTKQQQ
jgi:hypothetical protein